MLMDSVKPELAPVAQFTIWTETLSESSHMAESLPGRENIGCGILAPRPPIATRIHQPGLLPLNIRLPDIWHGVHVAQSKLPFPGIGVAHSIW